MADELALDADEHDETEEKKKPGMLVPLLFGLVLALSLGIGAAVAVIAGVVPLPGLEKAEDEKEHKEEHKDEHKEEDKVVFVNLEQLMISIGRDATARTLRLSLSIETTEHYSPKVEQLKPRILDALNTLLRSADARDFSEPRALTRLRAQMLRRARLAADPTAIRDLLITEYVVF